MVVADDVSLLGNFSPSDVKPVYSVSGISKLLNPTPNLALWTPLSNIGLVLARMKNPHVTDGSVGAESDKNGQRFITDRPTEIKGSFCADIKHNTHYFSRGSEGEREGSGKLEIEWGLEGVREVE